MILIMKKNPLLYLSIIPIAFMFQHCSKFFDDPLQEFDPQRVGQQNIVLSSADHYAVKKINILETFGSYGCVNCPPAESTLSPYYSKELVSLGKYDSSLIVVTYHVKFGSDSDPWITPNTQTVYNAYSYQTTLPEIRLNGSNSRYGFSENIAAQWKEGMMDTLLSRRTNFGSTTFIEIVIDSQSVTYDTSQFEIRFNVKILNRSLADLSNLSLRILAAKNRPVTFLDDRRSPIKIYTYWEVVVLECIESDPNGNPFVINNLPALRGIEQSVRLILFDEKAKQIPSSRWWKNISQLEPLSSYAIVVLIKNEQGIIENAAAHQYAPQRDRQ